MTDLEHATIEVKLDLANGARLKLLVFPPNQVQWILEHTYESPRPPRQWGALSRGDGWDQIICETKLRADYQDGYLGPTLQLSMNVVLPARLGRQSFLGVDISPNAKTYIEFDYALQPERPMHRTEYHLKQLRVGSQPPIEVVDISRAFSASNDYPFPVSGILPVLNGGVVMVPFSANDKGTHVIRTFELPVRIKR